MWLCLPTETVLKLLGIFAVVIFVMPSFFTVVKNPPVLLKHLVIIAAQNSISERSLKVILHVLLITILIVHLSLHLCIINWKFIAPFFVK